MDAKLNRCDNYPPLPVLLAEENRISKREGREKGRKRERPEWRLAKKGKEEEKSSNGSQLSRVTLGKNKIC